MMILSSNPNILTLLLSLITTIATQTDHLKPNDNIAISSSYRHNSLGGPYRRINNNRGWDDEDSKSLRDESIDSKDEKEEMKLVSDESLTDDDNSASILDTKTKTITTTDDDNNHNRQPNPKESSIPSPHHPNQQIGIEQLTNPKNQTHQLHQPDSHYGPAIFRDDFDFLDFNKWQHELTLGGGGNWEFQFYNNNRSTSFVEDGKLFIKPVLTTDYLGISREELINRGSLDLWGNNPGFQCTANGFYGCQRSSNGQNIINPVMSAQLRTHHSFHFQYGKIEVRAQLPKGDWLWPAIWLLPKHYAYGGWPASGEIDLLESRGNAPGYEGHGSDTVASTLHWGPDWLHNQYQSTTKMYKLPKGKSFSDDFHTFTLEWTPHYIRTWVDSKHLILNIDHTKQSMWDSTNLNDQNLFNPWQNGDKNAPFDQDFTLILNLAVGGTNHYFPDLHPQAHPQSLNLNTTARPPHRHTHKPWSNQSPTAARDFLLHQDQWHPTWQPPPQYQHHTGAFIIDYIHVFPYTGPH